MSCSMRLSVFSVLAVVSALALPACESASSPAMGGGDAVAGADLGVSSPGIPDDAGAAADLWRGLEGSDAPQPGDVGLAPDGVALPDGLPVLDVSPDGGDAGAPEVGVPDSGVPDSGPGPDSAGAPADTGTGGDTGGDWGWEYRGLCAGYLDCTDGCAEDDVTCAYGCWYGADYDCRECLTDYSNCLYGNDCVGPDDEIRIDCFYAHCADLYDVCIVGDTAPACVDADGDGYGRHCDLGSDCDDADPGAHPGAAEVCDGRDQDCDGRIDEKVAAVDGGCEVVRDWGVLVYMSADNDLTDSALFDIADLAAKGGTDDRVGVALQVELNGAHSLLDDFLPVELYERTWRTVVSPDPTPEWDTLLAHAFSLGDVDLTAPAALADFLDWGRLAIPAERYLVILWDHGGGWAGVLSDDGSFDFMSMPRVREGLALSELRADVLLFNACSMGMVEVVAELDGLADYVVASEEVSYGNPNGDILARLHADPTMGPREVAVMAHDETVRYDESIGGSYTIAAYDMAGASALVDAVDALAAALLANLDAVRGHVDAVLPDVQSMAFGADRDLADLAHELQGSGIAAVDEAAAAVEALATAPGFLVRSSAANGPAAAQWSTDLSDAHGLAIHFPRPGQTNERELTSYAEVALSQRGAAGWDDFLAAWLGDGPIGRAGGEFRVTLEWTRGGAPAPAVDLDLLLYEPETGWAAPYLGSETPNGRLSGDSLETDEARETYEAFEDVAAGTYIVLVRAQDPGIPFEPVTATITFEDPLWPENGIVMEAQLSNRRPCFLGETVLPPEVLRGQCDDLWFAGKLIRDGESHPLVGDIYGDFGLRPLPRGPLSPTPPAIP